MDLSQLQLRQDIKGKTFYITIKLEIVLPTGEVCQFQVLYTVSGEIS